MLKKSCSTFILMLAYLGCLPASHAQPETRVYKMPETLLQKLKTETGQRQRGECEQKKRELFSSHFYALDNKLLLLIDLPDYFCNSGSFIPVTVDSQGHWEAGNVIESLPTELLTDTAHQLWLVSHWEIEAVVPLLHHSIDGVHWQEISLPKERKIDCCFEYIKQICINASQIQLKFTGLDDSPVEYWRTTVNDSLKATPVWQKLPPQQLNNQQQCQSTPLSNGDWKRKPSANASEIQFQSAMQHISVIIPHWLK